MRSRVAAVATLAWAISAAGCGALPATHPSGAPGTSFALASSPSAAPTPGYPNGTRQGPPWRPTPGQLFQIQLSGEIDLSVDAQIYEFDAVETPASVLDTLRPKWGGDHHFFCYIDAGSWERYRPDAAAFPEETLGKTMEGWPDERWLDIRRIDLLAPIIRARLDTCKAKGFDGVDPDNVDGYANDTGFPLTADDQLRFNRWLAAEAHARGLLVMLKNDGDQAAELVAGLRRRPSSSSASSTGSASSGGRSSMPARPFSTSSTRVAQRLLPGWPPARLRDHRQAAGARRLPGCLPGLGAPTATGLGEGRPWVTARDSGRASAATDLRRARGPAPRS